MVDVEAGAAYKMNKRCRFHFFLHTSPFAICTCTWQHEATICGGGIHSEENINTICDNKLPSAHWLESMAISSPRQTVPVDLSVLLLTSYRPIVYRVCIDCCARLSNFSIYILFVYRPLLRNVDRDLSETSPLNKG